MSLFTEKRKEILKEMGFLEYLEVIRERINNIYHRKKDDSAYNECEEIIKNVVSRYSNESKPVWDKFTGPSFSQRLDGVKDILKPYKYNWSDVKKKERIKEFISDLKMELDSMIYLETVHLKDSEKPIED